MHGPRLKVFVASASEAQQLDMLVRAILDDLNVQVIGWRDLVGPGEIFIDGLMKACSDADAAILIASPDDFISSRGEELLSPRDNIILEIGMCLSGLGRDRVMVAHFADSKGQHPKLPSDLQGLFVLRCSDVKKNRLELEIHEWVKQLQPRQPRLAALIEDSIQELDNHSERLGGAAEEVLKKYILDRFNHDVESLRGDQIILSQSEYFSELNNEMDMAGEGTQIVAVATMSSEMWDRDPEQTLYAAKNLDAAQRGARIKRLFVCSDRDWSDIFDNATQQVVAGIEVRRASTTIMRDSRHLVDIAVFTRPDGTTRGYIAEKDIQNPARIRRGRLILQVGETAPSMVAFEQAWSIATSVKPSDTVNVEAESPFLAPGKEMHVHFLESEVVTCDQAAAAKGTELKVELKSLILSTSDGLVALHLRGDRRASLRAVKLALDVGQAHMLPENELEKLGLIPGTVSAVLEPVWSMPHLVSRSILALEQVSTNAGSLTTYFKFKPEVLLQARSVLIGDFEE